ncbi:MAG: hypothetical protein ACYTBJ_10400 [Planctomycetota bacterium]
MNTHSGRLQNDAIGLHVHVPFCESEWRAPLTSGVAVALQTDTLDLLFGLACNSLFDYYTSRKTQQKELHGIQG